MIGLAISIAIYTFSDFVSACRSLDCEDNSYTMQLFKAFKLNGVSLNLRLNSGETQPLMARNRESKSNQYIAAIVGTCEATKF